MTYQFRSFNASLTDLFKFDFLLFFFNELRKLTSLVCY